MKIKFSILILVILINELNLFAQDTIFTYPSRSEITVALNAIVEKNNEHYIYNYTVVNSIESKQNLEEFYIEYLSEINNISNPSTWIGLRSDTKIPVIIWGSNKDVYDISQGNKLEGFSFQSKGIPSVLNFYAAGNVEEPIFDYGEAPPLESTKGLDIFENSKSGKTIAPVLPPDPFNPLVFLDTLRSFIPQSLGLNWLGDGGFAGQLEAQLGQVRSQLVAGDSAQAAATLTEFIGQVEQVNDGDGPAGATLTSEGYALLYFNGRYLLDRLPEPTPVTALGLLEGLIADTRAAEDNGGLGPAKFEEKLLKRLFKARKELAEADSVKAAKEVQKYWKEVEKEYKKGAKKSDKKDKKFVTEQAYRLLQESTNRVLEALPDPKGKGKGKDKPKKEKKDNENH